MSTGKTAAPFYLVPNRQMMTVPLIGPAFRIVRFRAMLPKCSLPTRVRRAQIATLVRAVYVEVSGIVVAAKRIIEKFGALWVLGVPRAWEKMTRCRTLSPAQCWRRRGLRFSDQRRDRLAKYSGDRRGRGGHVHLRFIHQNREPTAVATDDKRVSPVGVGAHIVRSSTAAVSILGPCQILASRVRKSTDTCECGPRNTAISPELITRGGPMRDGVLRTAGRSLRGVALRHRAPSAALRRTLPAMSLPRSLLSAQRLKPGCPSSSFRSLNGCAAAPTIQHRAYGRLDFEKDRPPVPPARKQWSRARGYLRATLTVMPEHNPRQILALRSMTVSDGDRPPHG